MWTMTLAVKTATFAEQIAFAAQVAKEQAAVEWAMAQCASEQQDCELTRRRVRRRRATRDGQEIFAVTFFDGNKPKRTDWLAGDSKSNAEFGVKNHTKGSLGYRLQQLKGKELSKSRSEPCLSTKKRERRSPEGDPLKLNPFRTLFPLPKKGVDMRKETARDQADLFKPRSETVALSAKEKHEMRMWGIDVDAVCWSDGTKPPRWVKAVGHTTNKWRNREMAITAAREEQEFVEQLGAPSPTWNSLPSTAQQSSTLAEMEKAHPLPPWVKELPPVRDGRRQLASGEIIPFLDQHVYPDGGVAEVKRARRREKEAFLKSVFVVNDAAAGAPVGGCCSGQRKVVAAAADADSTVESRSQRATQPDGDPGWKGSDGGGEEKIRRETLARGWPCGDVCLVVPRKEGNSDSRHERGCCLGAGSCMGESRPRAVVDASCDFALPATRPISSTTVAISPNSCVEGAGVRSQDIERDVDEYPTRGRQRDEQDMQEWVAGKGDSGCSANGIARHGSEKLQLGDPRREGFGSVFTTAENGRKQQAVAPSPVVTTSVRVLDIGVVGSAK